MEKHHRESSMCSCHCGGQNSENPEEDKNVPMLMPYFKDKHSYKNWLVFPSSFLMGITNVSGYLTPLIIFFFLSFYCILVGHGKVPMPSFLNGYRIFCCTARL